MEKDMNKIINIAKTYGFIYPGSEIYGGLANTWDYGPLGSLLKNNIKNTWRKKYVQEQTNSYEVDASILMHPNVWVASGHVGGFSDPLMDCKECKTRHRADKLIESFTDTVNPDSFTSEEMYNYIIDNKIPCPNCGKVDYTNIREFNLMFQTNRGVTTDKSNTIYLRPENAQGEYVNYLNVLRSMRTSLPFGIGQIGKAFRNEITPGNFTFRTIEFEQMEYQIFCKTGTDEELYNKYKKFAKEYIISLGINEDNLRYKDHEKLAHYAKAACDIEYKYPFGWGELNGTHNRTDFDLSAHQAHSKTNLEYLDPETNEKSIPYIVESTIGADRLTLAILSEAYYVDESGEEPREVMKFIPALAPYKVAILPLMKKYHTTKAREVYETLAKEFSVTYDETATIGKRYRRQDIIGTPYCITIDDNTLTNNTVTIRNRDTMEQITIKLDEVKNYINEQIKY